MHSTFDESMNYRHKQLFGHTEFAITERSLEISLVRNWFNREQHSFPKSSFSNATGWAEARDSEISSTIQGLFLLAFIAVVFLHVNMERAGWTLWGGIAVTISGMIFGSLLSPKRKVFFLYSTSGQPIVAVNENRGDVGRRDFQEFVESLKNWIKKEEVEPGSSYNSGQSLRD